MSFIQEQNIRREQEEFEHRTSNITLRSIFCNSTVKGIIAITLFAAIIPLLIYYLVFDLGSYKPVEYHSCSVNSSFRIQCGRENANYDYCNSISCCFDNDTKLCFHFLPSKYYYSGENNELKTSLKETPFRTSAFDNIAVAIIEEDEASIMIVLHKPSLKIDSVKSDTPVLYSWNMTQDPLSIDIFRNSTQELLFTTSKGPLITSEDYWEWTFHLSDEFLFGLGESLIDLEIDSKLTKVVYSNRFDHNSQPVFMGYKNGNFHGLTVKNDGPLEVTVLPSNLVVLKSIVGDSIELRLSIGPSVKEVMHQQGRVLDLDGEEIFGLHICRDGSTIDLDKILTTVQESDTSDLSYNSDCIHKNLNMALLLDATKADDIFQEIKNRTNDCSNFWLSLTPQVPIGSELYNNTKEDIYYKRDGAIFNGSYLNLEVAFPDFNHEEIPDVVGMLMEIYRNHDCIPKYLAFTDNWPVEDSFNFDNSSSNFTYLSQDMIDAMSYTIPWSALDSTDLKHIYSHNNYGMNQLNAFLSSSASNTALFTSSHDMGASYPILIENFEISWENFERSLKILLSNSIFGHHLTSIPICGSNSTTVLKYESLCARWFLMAATAPLFRISDIAILESSVIKAAALRSIKLRNELTPYFMASLKKSEPIMRPLFYNFPNDTESFKFVNEYMIGDNILVVHPMVPDIYNIRIYLPKEIDVWYEFLGGLAYNETMRDDGWINFPIVSSDWIAFVLEGSVVPLRQESGKFKIVIALNDSNSAIGEMWYNNMKFMFTANNVSVNIVTDPPNQSPINVGIVNVYSRNGAVRYTEADFSNGNFMINQ